MLPPGLQNKQTHQYGTLTCLVNTTQIDDISSLELSFKGTRVPQQKRVSSNQMTSFTYSIRTNLWHFYAYLHDAKTLSISFQSQRNNKYKTSAEMCLVPSHKILNKSNSLDYILKKNAYLLNTSQKLTVTDINGVKKGQVNVQFKLDFKQQIHRVLANIIDLSEILVIDSISPINSAKRLPPPSPPPTDRFKLKDEDIPMINKSGFSIKELQTQRLDIKLFVKQEISRIQPVKQNTEPQDFRYVQSDQKMMEADIDRLIVQMQNKPYDSSRYLQNQSRTFHNENFNITNTSRPTVNRTPSRQKPQRKLSSQKMPPKYPQLNQTPVSLRTAYPVPMQSTPSQSRTLLAQTQPLPTNSKLSRQSSQGAQQFKANRTGIITLQIHELMFQQIQYQLSLLLKIYLNDDNHEYYSVNGIRQGQTISFSSKLKIDQGRDITSVRFEMIDSFDLQTVVGVGHFDMERLFSQSPTKGVFMVSITPRRQMPAKVVRADINQLVKITPNMKTLRVQMQYNQPIEIVQIYLSLSQFSPLIRKIRYKVPFTKETIEFRISDLANSQHINIFPHNRSATHGIDKLFLEVWGQSDLIGMQQVSLKALSNTNQKIINSSIEPIYLYDQTRSISNFKAGKGKTALRVNLCYGTVSQVQSILNRQHMPKKQISVTSVAVQQHLGIYIKETKNKAEVQVQVDQDFPQKIQENVSRKALMSLCQQDQQQQQEDIVQQMTQLQSKNQFLNQQMQNEWNKQTLPVLPTSEPSIQKEMDFSKTIKEKSVLRSPTVLFQQKIRDCLIPFKDQSLFNLLKERCKPHLLYNIIEQPTLCSLLADIGISQADIDFIVGQALSVSSHMININLVYDMIFGLILEGQVKQKFIDDAQIGKFCLKTLYCRLNQLNEDDDQTSQKFLLDDETEFKQAKIAAQKVGLKLSMREYSLIKIYVKKMQDSCKTLSFIKMKEMLISEEQLKKRTEQNKKTYQKEVISKIYQWDQDDDFFISNLNPNNNTEKIRSPTVQINESSENINVDNLSNKSASRQISKPYNNRKDQSISSQTQRRSKPDQNSPVRPQTQRDDQIQKQNRYAYELSVNTYQQQMQQQLSERPSTGNNLNGYRLTITGLNNCLQATQCQLNLTITAPFLKINYSDPQGKSWCHSENIKGKESCVVDLQLSENDLLEGSVFIGDAGVTLGRCNFSVMKDLKCSYTIKSIEKCEFCGLIALFYQQTP